MRLAILGDIHGNVPALEAALRGAARENAEALCLTGDYVGYYYEAGEVLRLLSAWKTYRVRGNHEDMLRLSLADPGYLAACTRRYGSGIRLALQSLDAAQIRELTTLPSSLRLDFEGVGVLLCHGSPSDVDEYVYPDAPAAVLERVADSGADIVLMGHTHYRMARDVGGVLLVNPGSVGQQRDRIAGAAWALLDTASRQAALHSEPYDVAAVAAAARATDPHLPYLHDILYRH